MTASSTEARGGLRGSADNTLERGALEESSSRASIAMRHQKRTNIRSVFMQLAKDKLLAGTWSIHSEFGWICWGPLVHVKAPEEFDCCVPYPSRCPTRDRFTLLAAIGEVATLQSMWRRHNLHARPLLARQAPRQLARTPAAARGAAAGGDERISVSDERISVSHARISAVRTLSSSAVT